MACASIETSEAPPLRHGDNHFCVEEAAFRRFLAWLDDGTESFGERYLEVRDRLISYFDRRHRRFADELADETFKRVAMTLERDGSIDVKPPARYCYVVAKFVLLEDVRREQRSAAYRASQFAIDSQRSAALSLKSENRNEEDRLAALEACLQALPHDQRELIVEYYGGAGGANIAHRRQMAERLGITTNALGIRTSRIRRRLEQHFAALRREAVTEDERAAQ